MTIFNYLSTLRIFPQKLLYEFLLQSSVHRSRILFLPIHAMPRRERIVRLLQANGIDLSATNSCTYVIYRNMVAQNPGVVFTAPQSPLSKQFHTR